MHPPRRARARTLAWARPGRRSRPHGPGGTGPTHRRTTHPTRTYAISTRRRPAHKGRSPGLAGRRSARGGLLVGRRRSRGQRARPARVAMVIWRSKVYWRPRWRGRTNDVIDYYAAHIRSLHYSARRAADQADSRRPRAPPSSVRVTTAPGSSPPGRPGPRGDA